MVFIRRGFANLVRLFWSLDRRSFLIFHSIFWFGIWVALFCCPVIWRRCVWVIWGGDVYCFRVSWERWTTPGGVFRDFRRIVYRQLRKTIVRRFGVVGTLAPGDFDVLQTYCGKLDNYRRLFYGEEYPVFSATPAPGDSRERDRVRVCLGNSATDTNCHLEALQWLSRFRGGEHQGHLPA